MSGDLGAARGKATSFNAWNVSLLLVYGLTTHSCRQHRPVIAMKFLLMNHDA